MRVAVCRGLPMRACVRRQGGKKGAKGKKAKPLPGAKLCGTMDVDHMLSVLVENKIVNNVRPRQVSELRGTFNYLGSAYQVRGAFECWCELMCIVWRVVQAPRPPALLPTRTHPSPPPLPTLLPPAEHVHTRRHRHPNFRSVHVASPPLPPPPIRRATRRRSGPRGPRTGYHKTPAWPRSGRPSPSTPSFLWGAPWLASACGPSARRTP